jgi:DNA-binding response OmpR family regulator
MGKGRVLVIDGDDWVAQLLADGLRDFGFDVSTCLSGADGLSVAQTIEPDCIVSEMVLPEIDGPTLVRSIRSAGEPIGSIPVLFLTNADDLASRGAAFMAGGDLYLTKPFRVDEIVMQVQALVSMAGRLAGRPTGTMAPPPAHRASGDSVAPDAHAFEGNIAQMSIATILTLLEMERRSGVLKVSSKDRSCTLELVAGCAIGGSVGGMEVSPLAALRELLKWQEGRFRFRPGREGAIPSNRRSIGALLIEAVRLDDESSQNPRWADEKPSSRRSAPPSARRSVPPPAGLGKKPPQRRPNLPNQPAVPPAPRPPVLRRPLPPPPKKT